MKIGTIAIALVAASLASISLAQKAMSTQEWQKGYNEAAKAFEAMDAKAVTAYMTPDFQMTMNGQTMNLTQSKASLAQWFGMMKDLHCKFTVKSAMHKGAMATVIDQYSNWGMTKPDPKTKKSSKMVDTGTETATWVWMKGKWMMKSLRMSNQKTTLDGKPMKMG